MTKKKQKKNRSKQQETFSLRKNKTQKNPDLE